MTTRPTPETDALTESHAAAGADNMTLQYVDIRQLARNLERQRDEAVELLREFDTTPGSTRALDRTRAFLARLDKEK